MLHRKYISCHFMGNNAINNDVNVINYLICICVGYHDSEAGCRLTLYEHYQDQDLIHMSTMLSSNHKRLDYKVHVIRTLTGCILLFESSFIKINMNILAHCLMKCFKSCILLKRFF